MIGQNVYNRVSEQAEWVGHESKEMVNHYPVSSALIAFGLGVGAGVALVALLCDDSESYASSSYAQRLGRQVLDAVSHVVPESVTKKVWS